MKIVLPLIIVILLNYYIPQVPFLNKIHKLKSSNWLMVYLEYSLKLLEQAIFPKRKLTILLIILPILLLLYLLDYIIYLLGGIIGSTIFIIFVLYYCLENNFNNDNDSIFITAHEETFAIIFWFTILGAPGAMLYWLLKTMQFKYTLILQRIPNLQLGLELIHNIIAWIPARITGLIFALVGSFNKGFASWYNCIQTTTIPSSQVLTECGMASLDSLNATQEEEITLVKRAFIAWFVFSILIALAIY